MEGNISNEWNMKENYLYQIWTVEHEQKEKKKGKFWRLWR